MCHRLKLDCIYQETTAKCVDIQVVLANLQLRLHTLEPRLFKAMGRVSVNSVDPALRLRIRESLLIVLLGLVMRMGLSLGLHLKPTKPKTDLSLFDQSATWWRLWCEYTSQSYFTREAS